MTPVALKYYIVWLCLCIYILCSGGCTNYVFIPKSKSIRITHDLIQEKDSTGQSVNTSLSDTATSNKKLKQNLKRHLSQKTAYDTLTRIDSLIHTAQTLCADNRFTQAHALLIEVTLLIERLKEQADVVVQIFERHFSRIAELYTTAFPEKYLDSIPEHVSSSIFKYQIAQAIETVSGFADDSTFHSMLACEQGVPYNIPINHNTQVHAALYTILTRRHRTAARFLNAAYYYLPFTQSLFAQNNLPTDLCFLPILESGYNPFSYSYAHASGIWQFIPSTGRIFGLRINYWIDERRDPYKSTLAAITYFQKLYDEFKNWHLALAAYNCGEVRVAHAIKRAGSSNFWHLKLPKQTRHYIPQFIAFQIIAKNPQCFGFDTMPTDIFNPDTVLISEGLDLYLIAEGIGIPYSFLKNMNPHLPYHCTPPHLENVTLYLPKGYAQKFKEFYETLSEEDKVVLFRYRIKGGDNLSSISRRFNIPLSALKSLNKLKTNYIIAGRYLYIPLTPSRTSSGAYKIKRSDIRSAIPGDFPDISYTPITKNK